ncbi:MAG: epoxyqueuosine reductase [Clostridia bacterium]|nr:epoxyqueuosine reductase [Clostridia bacterium]
MIQYDKTDLLKYGIEYSAPVPFTACRIINERKAAFLYSKLEPRSVVTFLVPYYSGEEKRNISKYAIAEDYHFFMRKLFDKLCPELTEKYGGSFFGMSDSSPVDEVSAASYAGLGVKGDNGMIINEKYASYVFIGAVYTDVEFECQPDRTSYCVHCGRCKAACPAKNGRECLSAVTQKKGVLSDEEIAYIKEFGSVWGCDICADVCPYSKKAEKTPIQFFYENRTPYLTKETLGKMSDEEFSRRAYSWRGKAVIERNLKLFE